MTAPALSVRLTHVGFHVTELEPMVAFYEQILGMVVTDRAPGRGVFMSRDPKEHHQIVLAVGRPEGSYPLINQISFRLDDLEALRAYHRFVLEKGVGPLDAVTHGNAWSLYFPDPEGNRIELYAGSPWHVSQPMRVAVDLGQSAEALLAQTEALIRDNPTRTSQADWSDAMRDRLSPTG